MGKYSMWLYPFIIIIFFFFLPSLSYSPQNHSCLALLQFKQTFGTGSYAYTECDYSGQPKILSWRRGTDCCRWDGVTCDGLTGHVIELDLSCSRLQGVIHSNSTLFHLSHLKRLNLAHNDFYPSRISHQFGRLATTLTHLNLSNTYFSGQIPSNIWHLSKLVSLDLSHNYNLWINKLESPNFLQNLTHLTELSLSEVNISSAVSMNLSSSLTLLDLSWTGLQGKLTDSIFHLPNLHTLDLSRNSDLSIKLEGPNFLQNLTQLTELSLSVVNISSAVPMNLSSSLTLLDLSWTGLHGKLPDSIFHLPNLHTLDLSGNPDLIVHFPEANVSSSSPLRRLDLSSTSLHGEAVPDSIAYFFKSLISLGISYNNLGGQFPNAVGKLKHLSDLSLAGNHFSGPFPCSIANLTQLVHLDLSSNSLTGPIPSNMVGLHHLTHLDFSNNLFNEAIPYWLFALPSLEYVLLNLNRFTGQIHEFQSKSLTHVSMRDNDLHGPFPRSISQQAKLVSLDLSGNNFTDIVDLETFSNLTNLLSLYLSYNNLSFTTTNTNINATFPNLLFLGLASCKMKEFPYLLKHSPNLVILDLSYNQIQGPLPNWSLIIRDLVALHLRSNLLQGPLPSFICNLSSLVILDLSSNKFGGVIPQCLGNFSDQLSVLDLRMNRFHGIIPTTFGARGNNLRSLNLHGNQLEGMLPPSLANCTHLEVLDVGNNQINDTFPHWLATLPQLQVLVLRYNRFHGPISSTSNTKFPFSMLRIIDLSHNQFTGFLPSKYFTNLKAMINVGENETAPNYMKAGIFNNNYYYDEIALVMKGTEIELVRILSVFTIIDLSNNKFKGEIPNFIGNLNSLRLLNLSHNTLTGHIPLVIGHLTMLESLDLSSNQLVGEIPQQLTSLTFLAVLNLSQNQLTGRIPQDKQFNTFQNDSYSGNLGLCGFPLSKKCGADETPEPPAFQERDDSNFASGFTWKVVLIGYGCGTVFGLVMGYLMFLTGKPKWFTGLVEKEQHKNIKSSVKKRGHKLYGRRN